MEWAGPLGLMCTMTDNNNDDDNDNKDFNKSLQQFYIGKASHMEQVEMVYLEGTYYRKDRVQGSSVES